MNLREGLWALLLGLAVHLVFLVSLSTQTLNPLYAEAVQAVGQAGDYFGIYHAGDNLIHGESIYDHEGYRNRSEPRVPYLYFYRYLPPTAYVSAVGARILSPWAGYWSWVVFNELLLAFLVFWILRLDRFALRERRLHAGLWLGFFPFYLEQWMGQFSFLMAAFLWILLRDALPDQPPPVREGPPRGRALRAWIASIGLKSYTALLGIGYLARRQVRVVIVAAVVVILVCAPYFFARPEDLRHFALVNFRPLPPGIHGGTLGASAFVRLLGWTLPDSFAGFRCDFVIFDVYVGNIPVFLFSIAVVVAALWVTLRHSRRMPIVLQNSLWVLTFFLIFKDVWEYHYVMLLPVITAVSLATRSRFVLWIGLVLALPTPYALLAREGSLSEGAEIVHHAWKVIPTCLLYGFILWKGWRQPGMAEAPQSEWSASSLSS